MMTEYKLNKKEMKIVDDAIKHAFEKNKESIKYLGRPLKRKKK